MLLVSIPRQLAKENKQFQYATIRKSVRSSEYLGSLQLIEDAGIISRCYNLTRTELPLDGYALADPHLMKAYDNGDIYFSGIAERFHGRF